MNAAEFRALLEVELSWRSDELRYLRNELLSEFSASADWPAAAMRTIIVVQYAHLEGFTQACLEMYVDAINSASLPASDLRSEIFSGIFAAEFRILRQGSSDDVGETERLVRRAKRQVAFVDKLRGSASVWTALVADDVVSLEMNLGSEVLRKNLYALGIPSGSFSDPTYAALEFFRRTRNDVAHGGRKENFPPGLFEAHWHKSEQYMGDLMRLLTKAVTEEWYRAS